MVLAATLAACTVTGPGTISVSPSPARDGRDGADGPFGAARISMATQVRVSERVNFEVTFPSDGQGNLRRDRAPFGTVAFVSGGLVAIERYRWIADHLATRGFVVVTPAFALDLAFFQPDNVQAALRATRSAATTPGHTLEGAIAANGRVAAMGHSLGGVVATWQWVDQSYDGVALLASIPSDTSRLLGREGARTLFLIGTQDRLSPATITAGFAAFRAPKLLGYVDGMSHYDWTDNASAADLARDGTPTRPQSATRRDALRVIDAFADAVLNQDTAAAQSLDTGTFAGVAVQR